jgi:pimeloyl-ACP methyl ester carboxylesterase
MPQVKIRGCHFNYEIKNEHGQETILLVHGHPFDHTMWDYQQAALPSFRLLLPDLKGYGKTDFDFDKIFIEEQALDLTLLLDFLQIEKVHLIGLSMGGQIIVEFCRLFPHRTKSLIICNSDPSAETEASCKDRLQLANTISEIGMEAYTKAAIHKYLHPDTITNNAEVYDHLYSMMVHTKSQGAAASHRGRAERRDNYGYLQKITIPVLVIGGTHDFFTPPAEIKRMASTIPSARCEIIEGAGHLPNMEQPALFNEVLQDFYKGL